MFAAFLAISILFSCFRPLPAGPGLVGIASPVLTIGDRAFYINDQDPYDSQKGYKDLGISPSPLYPRILEGVTFASGHLFESTSTSAAWNSLLIIISGIAAFSSGRLIYETGKIVASEKVGLIAMMLFAACPYTYFYTLSGGLSIFVVLGVSSASLFFVRVVNCSRSLPHWEDRMPAKDFALLCASLVYLMLLRPSAIIFSFILMASLIWFWCRIQPRVFQARHLPIPLLALSVTVVVGVDQYLQSLKYIQYTASVFAIEGGSFFGYPRTLLRENIQSLAMTGDTMSHIKRGLFVYSWKALDFISGILDIRDTHDAVSFRSLSSFLARVATGLFYLAPMTLISVLSILVNRKTFSSSGLMLLIVASLAAISPSLIGVAMSRYYYMFMPPLLIASSLLIVQLCELHQGVDGR